MQRSNVVVDGLNLAYRVYHALKVIDKPMTDDDGNPTGLLFGFLRSLGALKKRFPNATFHVVWEGSRKRRSSVYPAYKATRGASPLIGDTQLDKVKQVLPWLGVSQAHNSAEEADDIIASLVRGPLKGDTNIIVSTDHDFLQLVTFTDSLLVPKVGKGIEKLYDPDGVMAEYGVPPDRVVHLRAMSGDISDNLPGIPRVREKTLKGLLRTHGSIEAIYDSHMAGLTTSEYEGIRASRELVFRNLQLMILHDDLQFDVVGPSPDSTTATSFLQQHAIQPATIVDSFLQVGTTRGFVKTG
jgi:DNA polymerase I